MKRNLDTLQKYQQLHYINVTYSETTFSDPNGKPTEGLKWAIRNSFDHTKELPELDRRQKKIPAVRTRYSVHMCCTLSCVI